MAYLTSRPDPPDRFAAIGEQAHTLLEFVAALKEHAHWQDWAELHPADRERLERASTAVAGMHVEIRAALFRETPANANRKARSDAIAYRLEEALEELEAAVRAASDVLASNCPRNPRELN